MPKVSIIIPVFNGARTLERAVHSAQVQTIGDTEILIIDDGSTDGTWALTERIASEDTRVRIHRLDSNQGVSVARNVGLDQATGEWVAMLDADDWLDPSGLQAMIEAGSEHGAVLVFGNLLIFDHAHALILDRTQFATGRKPRMLDAATFFRRDTPLQVHAMGYMHPVVRRAFLEKAGIRYEVADRMGQDFVFATDILLSGGRTVIVPGAYYVYVHHRSPTTRRLSPDTRSETSFDLVVRACASALRRYEGSIDAQARAALEARKAVFESWLACDELLKAAQAGRVGTAVRVAWGQPLTVVLLLVTLAKLARANVLLWWRKAGFRIDDPLEEYRKHSR